MSRLTCMPGTTERHFVFPTLLPKIMFRPPSRLSPRTVSVRRLLLMFISRFQRLPRSGRACRVFPPHTLLSRRNVFPLQRQIQYIYFCIQNASILFMLLHIIKRRTSFQTLHVHIRHITPDVRTTNGTGHGPLLPQPGRRPKSLKNGTKEQKGAKSARRTKRRKREKPRARNKRKRRERAARRDGEKV